MGGDIEELFGLIGTRVPTLAPRQYMADETNDEAAALLISEPLIAHLTNCLDGKPHITLSDHDGRI